MNFDEAEKKKLDGYTKRMQELANNAKVNGEMNNVLFALLGELTSSLKETGLRYKKKLSEDKITLLQGIKEEYDQYKTINEDYLDKLGLLNENNKELIDIVLSEKDVANSKTKQLMELFSENVVNPTKIIDGGFTSAVSDIKDLGEVMEMISEEKEQSTQKNIQKNRLTNRQ